MEWYNGVITQGFELPITRYSRIHGSSSSSTSSPDSNEIVNKSHPRFVYAFGAFALGSKDYDTWAMFKFDTEKWKVDSYYFEDSMYLSEPAFVPDPEGTQEDDGVILTQAFDGKKKETALLVLDAKTMKVKATVWTGTRVPMDFHGAWIPKEPTIY